MRVQMIAINRAKPLRLVIFAPKQLHDAHPRDSLLQEGVDARQLGADLPIRLAHASPEHRRDPENPRHNQIRRDRHPPIDDDHQDRNRPEGKEITEPRDHSRREQLVERLHVVGDARDEAPHWITVKKGDRESLQMRKELPS